MDQGEVYFLKMNNGEDLLVQLVGDEEDCLWVTQPYRVELIPSTTSMTVVTSIMRWLPFESLMDEKVRIIKTNILTYLAVDDIVAYSYLNTISEQAKEERKKFIKARPAIANTSGSLH
jgi:hypothetical protein